MKRLQGKKWYEIKDHLKLIDIWINKNNGHIKGTYEDKHSGEPYIHWLNDSEIKKYKEEHDDKED